MFVRARRAAYRARAECLILGAVTRAVAAGFAAIPGLLLLSAPAIAYRPFDSTDADVAEPGELELELEPFGYLHAVDGSFFIVPDVVVNLGLRDRWELVLEGQHRVRTRTEPDAQRSRVEDTGCSSKG